MDMLRIKEKDIIVDKSELLYRADFSNGGLEKDFEIAGGKWVAENDGVLGYMEEDGGGFIGMGQPTSSMRGGRFFQLAGALGVDEELSFSNLKHKYNYTKVKNHFITAEANGEIDYGGDLDNIYALDGTKILDIAPNHNGVIGLDAGYVRMACNEYGKGRTFYMTGMACNAVNTRILYRALLWVAHKEEFAQKAYSTNVNTECHYYAASKQYAVLNNSTEEQKTTVYDINGNATEMILKPLEIRWLNK